VSSIACSIVVLPTMAPGRDWITRRAMSLSGCWQVMVRPEVCTATSIWQAFSVSALFLPGDTDPHAAHRAHLGDFLEESRPATAWPAKIATSKYRLSAATPTTA
jgi:hypothetical protein